MLVLKTSAEIEIMADGGRKLAEIVAALNREIRIGITTKELDRMALHMIHEAGAEPAFLNYRAPGSVRPYPCSICTSINDVVVHGQPSDYKIKDGDLVKLDLGLRYMDFCTDMAITVGVGRISAESKRLMEVTEKALSLVVNEVRVGKTLGDIGYVVERIVKQAGFSVADELTGHGIGRNLHEDPTVFNFGRRGEGEELEVGMVLAIEPMVAMGSGRVRQLKDGSFITADGLPSAHYEHTVAVTKDGPKILTK